MLNYCPICGEFDCSVEELDENKYFVECQTYKKMVILNKNIFQGEQIEINRRVNSAMLHQISHTENNQAIVYYYDEKVINSRIESNVINIYPLMFNYPNSFLMKIDGILLNMFNEHKSFNDEINMRRKLPAEFYCDGDIVEDEKTKMAETMEELGYFKKEVMFAGLPYEEFVYKLTAKAWEKIDSIKNTSLNDGFIAMSFDDKNDLLKDAIKKSIEFCGFRPVIMKDYHHNNYIMPEIFYQINKCKFMIVDISDGNHGAYYEAGYAQALGKEVIVICKKSVFSDTNKKPHFDIAQKSMIIFDEENLSKLSTALEKRIEATVGNNNNRTQF